MSPRPILRPQADQQSDLRVVVADTRARVSGGTVNLVKRDARYTSVLTKLDAGQLHAADMSTAIEAIAANFPLGTAQPLGLVAQCYLGPPYEVHTLDMVGQIVEHYGRGQAMPPFFERARRLAAHPAYVAIEVYEDVLVCVRADGSVTEVRS
jgi:hypothetical protein